MNRLFIKNYHAQGEIAKYSLVCLTEDGKAAIATDSSKPILGVSDDRESRNGRVDITLAGIVPVYAAEALNAGILITCDSEGKAKAAADGDYAIGITLGSASTAGDIIEILIK